MEEIILKILGYYTLFFITVRFFQQIRADKNTKLDKIIKFIATLIVYLPLEIFVISQLMQMGLNL